MIHISSDQTACTPLDNYSTVIGQVTARAFQLLKKVEFRLRFFELNEVRYEEECDTHIPKEDQAHAITRELHQRKKFDPVTRLKP